MTRAFASACFGIGTYVLAAAAAVGALILSSIALDALDIEAEAGRRFAAGAVTISTFGAGAVVLLGLPLAGRRLWRLNPWIALGSAALLAGATVHFLLLILSVTNSCDFFVSFPYRWIDACQR